MFKLECFEDNGVLGCRVYEWKKLLSTSSGSADGVIALRTMWYYFITMKKLLSLWSSHSVPITLKNKNIKHLIVVTLF